jgi:hypothetical protein
MVDGEFFQLAAVWILFQVKAHETVFIVWILFLGICIKGIEALNPENVAYERQGRICCVSRW